MWALSPTNFLTQYIIGKYCCRRHGANMCNCNVARWPTLHIFTKWNPQNQVSEGEIREQLPICNELAEAINLGGSEWALSLNKLFNSWHYFLQLGNIEGTSSIANQVSSSPSGETRKMQAIQSREIGASTARLSAPISLISESGTSTAST